MIIKVPLYIKNEDWIRLVKGMPMKMVKTMINPICHGLFLSDHAPGEGTYYLYEECNHIIMKKMKELVYPPPNIVR